MSNINHWQVKLAAWTHDPAEKALILMRDREGHEGGTVKALHKILFSDGVTPEMKKLMKKADHWAAAADRPNFPTEEYVNRKGKDSISQSWSTVRFYNDPVLLHPLSGEKYDLHDLNDVEVSAIKSFSLESFSSLVQRNDNDEVDAKKTALAFWRFGPEGRESKLQSLWQLLPADTRIPDHTIWAHLDLTSAFASAMAQSNDEQPALLTMSFGPVQDFIAQARSTSDLWAGSHLLSRLVWEGLKVICSELGPDSVLFPQLRGVALVDAWLQCEQGLDPALFKDEAWRNKGTDENPLFAAALTNKFTALVPSSRAKELAEKVTKAVRDWVKLEAVDMMGMLLKAADIDNDQDLPCWQQLEEQLDGFPEVHWASVPWSLIERDDTDLATPKQAVLEQVLGSFIPDGESFLDSDAWALLSKEIELDGSPFHQPNPGLLYPALFDLLDRLAAAAKSSRPFKQLKQQGYRCTLSGEHEWLTTDRSHLNIAPTKRKDIHTLWNLAEGKFGIKKGEHLGALGILKRLWPESYREYVRDTIERPVNRFVVSTHTLAMASSLENIAQGARVSAGIANQALNSTDGVVLPRKLVQQLHKAGGDALALAKGLPALMDKARDTQDDELLKKLEAEIKQLNGDKKSEAYFAMLLMDGDKMGAWLADSWPNDVKGNKNRLQFRDAWHPIVREKMRGRFSQHEAKLEPYLNSYRPISPARHMAISGALNSFALDIARHVVENCYMGKLLYAGGDDVMAMIAVKDLLPCMLTLRLAYSGVWPENTTEATEQLLNLEQMQIRRGHVMLKNKLHRVMGYKATASVGAVVAHHTAPLASVLRELRKAEKEAKNAGRDAMALRVIKRAGGAEHLSLPWLLHHQSWQQMPELESTSIGLLMGMRDQLASDGGLSRRFAYIVNTWLPQLPDYQQYEDDSESFKQMIETTLAAQLGRQGGEISFARTLMQLAGDKEPAQIKQRLRDIFAVAEFFARNNRALQGGQS